MIRRELKVSLTVPHQNIRRNGLEWTHLWAICKLTELLEKKAANSGTVIIPDGIHYTQFCDPITHGQQYTAEQTVPWWLPVELHDGPMNGENMYAPRIGWSVAPAMELPVYHRGRSYKYIRRGINSETGRYAYTLGIKEEQ